MPYPSLDDTFNSEVYLMRLATAAGLNMKFVDFSVLPSADAVLGRDHSICMVPEYSCIEPNLTRGDPPFCAWQHKSLLNMRKSNSTTTPRSYNYSDPHEIARAA